MAHLPLVREHMDTHVDTLSPTMNIFDAVDFLVERRVTGATVADADGTLLGVLSERDCLRLLSLGADNEPPNGQVRDFMAPADLVLSPDMDLYYAAGRFLESDDRRAIVVQDDRVVGQITRFDILRVIRTRLR